jgi:hypothetical protein
VGKLTVENGVQSPASLKMDEAIEAVLAGKPIVPGKSTFIDANTPYTGRRRSEPQRKATRRFWSHLTDRCESSSRRRSWTPTPLSL